MYTLSQVPHKMQQVLTTTADEAAHHHGFVKRSRKLTGGLFVETLVFTWLANPEATYTELAQTATALGTPITRQAIEQRFTPEAAATLKTTLEAAVAEVISTDPQTLPLLKQFNGVYLQDSTWISLPDELADTWKGGRQKNNTNKAAVKLQLRFDVTTGTFEHFQLTDGATQDCAAEKQMPMLTPGSLRLADRGYFSLDILGKLADAGVFWITQLKVDCALFDDAATPFCLLKWLKTQTTHTCETQVAVGKTKRLQARLVAQKLSEQETQKRIKEIKHRAKKKHYTPSKRRLQLARWNIYITNIKAEQLSVEQVVAITRIRWQIELMFKCFKSIGKIDTSRSNKPERVLSEMYAKLIVAIIRHWVMLVIGWRCLKHSLMKTAKLITTYARTLTISYSRSLKSIRQTFDEIKRVFQNQCYIEKRANKKTTLEHLKNAAKNH